MKYIKHKKHGILPVHHLTDTQKVAGWFICDIEEETKKTERQKNDVSQMTKKELEIYARTFGIELDRRKGLRKMLADFEEALKNGDSSGHN